MEREYWDTWYSSGGESGEGSVGTYRRWKWNIIKKYVNIKDKTVLDVGCGDLSFLNKRKFKEYLGLDISPTIIERNREKRPDLNFFVIDVTSSPKLYSKQYDVVLCMDLLFHIMTDEGFANLLRNLNRWTGELLFLVNWCKNPLFHRNDYYQYFRDLTKWFDKLPDLELIASHQKKGDSWNTIYVFTRKELAE